MFLKKSLNLLINYFSRVDDGIVYFDNKIKLRKHIYNSFFIKKKKLKLSEIIIFFLDIIIFSISILLFPIAIILYLNGFKISTTDNRTIGYHLEEMFFLYCYCEIKKINTKKILVFSPEISSANKYIDKFYFEEKFMIINNIFYGLIFVPLSKWNFLKLDIFFLNKDNNYILPSQIYKNFENYKKKNIKTRQEAIQKYCSKYLNSTSKFKLFNNKNIKKYQIHLNKMKISPKTKVSLIKLRESNNSNYRNSDIKNLNIVIKYLIKKNYKVIRITDHSSKKINFKNKNYSEINIENDYGRKIHAILLSFTNLFIGNISGPYNWTTPLFFPSNYIFFDLVNFSEKNPKYKKTKYLFKKIQITKNNKIINHKIAVRKYPEVFKIYSNKKINQLKFINNNAKIIIDSINKLQ